MGIAIAQNQVRRSRVHEILFQLVNFVFAPLYFVSIGLKADFSANFDLKLVLILILVASLGKILGATLGAWLSKMPFRESLAVGFGMNARGAMEILIASIALQYGIIDPAHFRGPGDHGLCHYHHRLSGNANPDQTPAQTAGGDLKVTRIVTLSNQV